MDLCLIFQDNKQNISKLMIKNANLNMHLMQIWVVLITERLEVGSNPFLFTLIQYQIGETI